jgi:hypothetical protein
MGTVVDSAAEVADVDVDEDMAIEGVEHPGVVVALRLLLSRNSMPSLS